MVKDENVSINKTCKHVAHMSSKKLSITEELSLPWRGSRNGTDKTKKDSGGEGWS